MWTQEGLSSGQLALAAFQSVFGNFGAIFVAVTVFLFVFSTIISAGFFGQIQAEILFGRKFSKVWEYYNTPGMYYLADRAAKEAKKAAK